MHSLLLKNNVHHGPVDKCIQSNFYTAFNSMFKYNKKLICHIVQCSVSVEKFLRVSSIQRVTMTICKVITIVIRDAPIH